MIYRGPGFLAFLWFRSETHRDRRPCTAACQVVGRWGHINWNSARGKKLFVTGWPEQPRQDKNLLNGNDQPNESIKEESPIICTPKVSHLPQCQQLARATPLWSLWFCSSSTSPFSVLSFFLILHVCRRSSLLMGEGKEPVHTTAGKPGPL
jgi:hypothetical protein